jgi:hypothetical protein
MIKVDVMNTSPAEQARIAHVYAGTNLRLLAEKVEMYEDFRKIPDLFVASVDWANALVSGKEMPEREAT